MLRPYKTFSEKVTKPWGPMLGIKMNPQIWGSGRSEEALWACT